jgi:uncharacterized membrane protein
MRFRSIIIIIVCLLLLTPLYYAQGQNDAIVYKIEINLDNSATWTITQVQDINGTIDSWDGFQHKIVILIDEAAIQTQRQMLPAGDSFQMASRISQDTQSKTTEYQFTWINFSTTNDDQIFFGDAFKVPNFFSKLYGEGNIQIYYPKTCVIYSISPEPNQQDSTTNIISWIRTQDFINGRPTITLIAGTISPTPSQITNNNFNQIYLLSGIVIATIIIILVSSFFLIRNRKAKIKAAQPLAPIYKKSFPLESEEEKILKVLRTNQGTAFQSLITEQCKFSKAKTSQLLTALERKGIVRRYKKGRDKIVILADKGKSEQP